MRKKLIYFINVPWGWIKQRPQFLAEELANYYDITVVNIDLFWKRQKSTVKGLKILNIYRLPFERIKFISLISKKIVSFQLNYYSRREYNIVWLTSPSLMPVAAKFFRRRFVVYDCMDDMLEFPNNIKQRHAIMEREKQLYSLADIVFTSAEYLKSKLYKRYGDKKIVVVNNAVTSDILKPSSSINYQLSLLFDKNFFNISYIGTISEWFDFDLIEEVIRKYNNVVFHLFGPSVVPIPTNDHICHHGSIPHSDVFSAMFYSDALIMPFIVTELIKSVNPVKLYEYIAAGKPCLAPEYGESVPFKDFVYLYKNRQNCLEHIAVLLHEQRVKSEGERIKFLEDNTWACRARIIAEEIDNNYK